MRHDAKLNHINQVLKLTQTLETKRKKVQYKQPGQDPTCYIWKLNVHFIHHTQFEKGGVTCVRICEIQFLYALVYSNNGSNELLDFCFKS